MYKVTLIMALLLASFVQAQTRSAARATTTTKKPTGKQLVAKKDSLKKDSIKPEVEVKLPREFMVYTKKARSKTDRTKLCINLVCPDTVINYCMNDSICRDPETSKILFEQRQGDTLYVLVFIEAFTKVSALNDDGRCSAGKETKLVFARWNTKTNEAKWKQKTISSCLKGITNMTKEPVGDWNGSAPLVLSYHRDPNFYEVTFDPAKYQLGFQNSNSSSNSDSEK